MSKIQSKTTKPTPTSETRQKSSQGLISGIASAVTGLANSLLPIPGIGGVATMVGGVSSVIGTIAGVFGMDKPLSIEAPKTVKNNWMNIANGMGLEQGTMLAVDPANQVERLGGEVHYEPKYDDINVIAQKPMLVYTAPISQTTPGATFLSIPVHPCLARVSDVTTVNPKVVWNYSSFMANNFRHWRGSMKYHVKIFASNFHSGRIRISYEPFVYKASSGPGMDRYQTIGKVIDVRGNSECSFSVPYMSNRPFLPSSLADLRYEVERYASLNTLDVTADPLNGYDSSQWGGGLVNGRLTFTLETPFAFPSSPIPNPYIAVYMSCGADVQFAEPNVDSYCNDVISADGLGVKNYMARNGLRCEANTLLPKTVPSPVPPVPPFTTRSFVETGKIESAATTVEEITSFEDVAEHETLDTPPSQEQEHQVFQETTLKDFLMRPRLIYSFDWKSSAVVGAGVIINPLGLFLQSPIVYSKLSGYRYFKFDIEVQIRTNGTKFHYGALAYNHAPYGYHVDSKLGIDTLSGLPGGVITPDTETVHTFTLPFLYPRTAFTDRHLMNQSMTPTDLEEAPNLGKVMIYPLVPLAGGTVSSADVSDVHVTVFAHLKNIELSGYVGYPTYDNFTVTTNQVRASTFSALFESNTIDDLLKTEIDYAPPGVQIENQMEWEADSGRESDYFEEMEGVEMMYTKGFTLDDMEKESCDPLIPGSSYMVPREALHGEYITHMKQLLSRPGFCGYVNGKRHNTFVSHYGWYHRYLPMLRDEKGFPSSVHPNSTDDRANYLGNPSFLDIFRSIFLIERGSINFKIFHLLPNGTTFGLGTLVTHDNMSMKEVDMPQTTLAAGAPFPMTVDQPLGTNSQKRPTPPRYSAGAMYFPPGNIVPMEVSSPYNHPDLFHYTPAPVGTAAHEAGSLSNLVTMQMPGIRIGLDNIPALPDSSMLVVLKSAGDDFQFSKIIPPDMSMFSFARNLNSANVPSL